MEHESGLFIFITAIIALIILAVWWNGRGAQNEQEILAQLKLAYDQAIQSGNKRLALQRGREFYARLGGGKLQMFYELVLANDLSTMDEMPAKEAGPQPIQEMSK